MNIAAPRHFSPTTTTAAQIARFDFFTLQDFAAPLKEEVPEADVTEQAKPKEVAPPPPPSFSEAELDAAKKKAYAEGMDAGRAQAKEEAQRDGIENTKFLATSVRELTAQMDQVQRHMDTQWKEQHDGLITIAHHIAQMVAGQAIEDKEMRLIEETLSNALPQLMTQPHLAVTVRKEAKERTEKLMQDATAQSGYKGTFTVSSDDALQAGDIKINWSQGNAERSLGDILGQIQTMFGEHLLDVAPVPPAATADISSPITDAEEQDAPSQHTQTPDNTNQ